MTEREDWLQALQDFGRGPDIAGDYAALMKDPLSLREYEMRGPRGRKTFVQSNDNNYSAELFQFPKLTSEALDETVRRALALLGVDPSETLSYLGSIPAVPAPGDWE
jgi:hypothetical protein